MTLTPSQESALFAAARTGNFKALPFAVTEEHMLHQQWHSAMTPIEVAAQHGKLQSVPPGLVNERTLLAKHPKTGLTALAIALNRGDQDRIPANAINFEKHTAEIHAGKYTPCQELEELAQLSDSPEAEEFFAAHESWKELHDIHEPAKALEPGVRF